MTVFSNIKILLDPKFKPPSAIPGAIRPSEILKGRVLKINEQGMVLFDCKRKKVWANVTFPVKENQEITVSVMETEPQLKLRLVDEIQTVSKGVSIPNAHLFFPTEKIIRSLSNEIDKAIGPKGWMLKSKSSPPRIRMALEQLFSHFRKLDVEKNRSDLGLRLRSYIENSGIFFEKKLHDKLQGLYRTHSEISARPIQQDFEVSLRQIHQHPEIRNIVTSDLKPCLLILKDFVSESGLTHQKGKDVLPPQLKLLIQRVLEGIAFQQTKTTELHHGKKISQQAVYADPRKTGRLNAAQMTEKETVRFGQRLTSKLSHFLKTADRNLDLATRDTLKNLVDKLEISISKMDGSKRAMDTTPLRRLILEEMPQHLQKLEQLQMGQAPDARLFDLKDLEDIRRDLMQLNAEIKDRPLVEDSVQKSQKPEIGQVISFLLPMAEENGRGKLKIFYSKKRKNRDNEVFKMSLLLQMQNIGDVRTDFFLRNEQLQITFFLMDHKIEDIIHESADSIKDSLGSHFSQIQVDVVVSEREIQVFEINHLLTDDVRLVDLTV